MPAAQPTGATTTLGRPLSARQWHSAEFRKRRGQQQGKPTPPARPSTARARQMFDGDLRAPLPARFAVPTPPPWAPASTLTASEKKLRELRKVLGPELKRAMAGITLSGSTHRERLLALFRALDRNGDGMLSNAELRDGMAQMAPPLPITPKQLEGIFDKIDSDGDGALSFAEFTAVFGLPSDRPEPETLPKRQRAAEEEREREQAVENKINAEAFEADETSSFVRTMGGSRCVQLRALSVSSSGVTGVTLAQMLGHPG